MTSLLFTGRNRSGSWQIRGEQLGKALNAKIELNASKVRGYDFVVIVKRAPIDLLHRLRTANAKVIWDIVDAWPQPEGNSWGRDRCMDWLRNEINIVKPYAIVAATEQMAKDCAEFKVPVLALPHHARPNQDKNPIRLNVRTVGYEGGDKYLGHWRDWVEEECKRRDWHFVMNPASLAELDVVVAFRHTGGYAPKHWKSNVKLANAQGSGTPCILNREAGYTETAKGGEFWADTFEELQYGFTALMPVAVRRKAAAELYSHAPQLNDIAQRYQAWLDQLKS